MSGFSHDQKPLTLLSERGHGGGGGPQRHRGAAVPQAHAVLAGGAEPTVTDVDAKTLSIAHSINEMFSNELANVSCCLSSDSFLHNFGANSCTLALILHECTNVTLLIPNKQVFTGIMSLSHT